MNTRTKIAEIKLKHGGPPSMEERELIKTAYAAEGWRDIRITWVTGVNKIDVSADAGSNPYDN